MFATVSPQQPARYLWSDELHCEPQAAPLLLYRSFARSLISLVLISNTWKLIRPTQAAPTDEEHLVAWSDEPGPQQTAKV